MKYLKQRNEFINNNFSNINKINEEAGGPLANDIPWGDSLLGRLINSTIRKIGIGADLVRMDPIINRLKDEFDKLIAEDAINKLPKEDKSIVDKIQLSSTLGVLKKAVDEGEDISNVRKVTEILIKEMESKNEDLLKMATQFLKDIELLDKSNKVSNDRTDAEELLQIHSKLVDNFTSVYNILCQFESIRTTKVRPIAKKEIDDNKSYTKQSVSKPSLMKTEAISEENISIDPSLITAIKPLYGYMKSNAKFTFPLDEKGRKNELLNVSSQENRIPLCKTYTTIRKNNVNENVTQLLNRPEELGKHILNLYNTTKSNQSGDFKGIDSRMKGEIVKFNSTMSDILSFSKKSEEKKESILQRYSKFIIESDRTSSDIRESNPISEKVKSAFYNIFSLEYLKKWTVEEASTKELETKIQSISEESKSITVTSIDPIIEIVKLFNRAYKLHTVEVIPSGRTGGKVSNKTRREYSFIGDGSTPEPSNSNGPWRNNKLFDKWEDSVLDIIKDPKYQVIFNEGTKFKFGDADTRSNITKSEGSRKQGGGKSLLSLINALLDGSKLYKSGAQSRFIEEYFNAKVSSDQLGMSSNGKNDVDINSSTASKVKKDKKKYSFKSIKSIPESTNTFYAIKSQNKKYYTYISSKDSNYFYIRYSESFQPLNKYISGVIDISKGEMDTIQMRERKEGDNSKFSIFFGKIEKSKFPLEPGENISINQIDINEYELLDIDKKDELKSETINIGKIEKIYGLLDTDSKLFILPDDKSKPLSIKDVKYKEKLK